MTGLLEKGIKDHPDNSTLDRPRKGRQRLLRGFSFSPDQPEGLFRLISETTQNDPNSLNGGVTYTWDEVGNRTSRTSTLPPAAGVTNQAFSGLYDTADRFINHSFDDNGSTLGADGRTFTYDSRRRLTRIQGTGLDVSYTYDSDGNLLQRIDAVAGTTTKYVFDLQNATGYSQTLEEIVNGTPKVRYTYGNRLISRAEWNGSQWQRRFYQFDGEGNVAFLTDETGNVTDRYTYADGRVIRHDGPSSNEFLMKGERVDPQTGLVFLRARWMDPNYERFMTRDSYEGIFDDPLTRNTYLFAAGNNINKNDPSGFSSDVTKISDACSGVFRTVLEHVLGFDIYASNITVYIWKYENMGAAGHASMRLNTYDEYISWWPENEDESDWMRLAGNATTATPAIKDRSFSQDVEGEKREPDHKINLRSYLEIRVYNWWNSFKTTHSWNVYFQNCADTVADGLEQAGAKGKPTGFLTKPSPDLLNWVGQLKAQELGIGK